MGDHKGSPLRMDPYVDFDEFKIRSIPIAILRRRSSGMVLEYPRREIQTTILALMNPTGQFVPKYA